MKRQAMTLRLPPELHNEAQSLADLKGLSLNQLIVEATQRYVSTERPVLSPYITVKQTGKKKRITLFAAQTNGRPLHVDEKVISNGTDPMEVGLQMVEKAGLGERRLQMVEESEWSRVRKCLPQSMLASGASRTGSSTTPRRGKRKTSTSSGTRKGSRGRSRSAGRRKRS